MQRITLTAWALAASAIILYMAAPCSAQKISTLNGLWLLAGVMPAGVPMDEVPQGLNEKQFYWFHEDGSLSMTMESQLGSAKHKGVWKLDENRLVITWENGVRNLVRVVTLGERSMILTGLDVRPLWFRFVRYF
ncbi:MAG: hypothetical protein RDU20_02850 [Desulfomonilaceae bacterium]|nr:hypothetical protein [Desulfomonilaceae bacterium]